MPNLVPTQTIRIMRNHPNKRKDKAGNPEMQSITPKIGEPFNFTDEEIVHIRAHDPLALREPVNETEKNAPTAEFEEIERVAREAEEEARKNKGAAGDAATIARTAAGKGGAAATVEKGANISQKTPEEQEADAAAAAAADEEL